MYKFDNKNRVGAELLIKVGYVEFPAFEKMVKAQMKKLAKPLGYFCGNCEYVKNSSGKSEYKLCEKLNDAEVKMHGCCNLWDFTNKPRASYGIEPKGID